MPPRILLLGTNGQVGHELLKAMAPIGDVTGLDRAAADFSRPESLTGIIAGKKPNVVIIAAAYTAVDRAEADRDAAFAVNEAAPRAVAGAAAELGAIVVHYSTDYVYDGTKKTPYLETDATGPLNVYGESKLAGERAVAANPRHLVFRTSWVVSARGSNFVRTMLRLARERDNLRVVADQFGAPTSARLIASVTASVLEQMLEKPEGDVGWGTYHLVAGGETSWHGLATRVIARAHEMGIPLKAKPESVAAIPASDYPTPARRPSNSRLDTSKLRAAFGVTLPDWKIGVDEVLVEIRSGSLP